MPQARTYVSAGSLRQALEERLKTIAVQEGIDLQRLRRQVAFDRLLARLLPTSNGDWVLKGGYAMELRFAAARSTRDLDFTLRSGDNEAALRALQSVGGVQDDFFVFRASEALMDLEAPPYGGARFPVEALMDGRAFVKFHVDVGIGDIVLDPLEKGVARDWLAFAGISPPAIEMIAREQHFAEKIHAYTLPRPTPNSRVRDLVDLFMLVESGSLDRSRCSEALRKTFQRRNTHGLPVALVAPPPSWELPFSALGNECRISLNYLAAFDVVFLFWQDLTL